jgi:hypothetical protein
MATDNGSYQAEPAAKWMRKKTPWPLLKSLARGAAMGTPFIGGGLPYFSQKASRYVVSLLDRNDAHTVLF